VGEHGAPGELGGGSGLVLDDGTLWIAWRGRQPPTLALAGEVDESSYPGLVAALAGAAGEGGELHLDLAGLDYCDLAGLRAMVRLASPDDGAATPAVKRVVLHQVPASLRTVLHIVGWDATPGLTVAGQDH
jgi:ABC-type transporter Mla MlaB component